MSHRTGSRLAPTRGFDTTIASNQPSFEPANIVARNGERELRSGAGTVCSEETTDTPKPSMSRPMPLSHSAKDGCVPLQDQHVTEHYGYRARHHPQWPFAIWDCGHGVMETVPFHAPVWAQSDNGRPVSLPADGWKQRRALAAYRELFADTTFRCQMKVLILSLPGVFRRVANPAHFDEYREEVCAIAHSHSFLVIEGEQLWERIEAFLKANGSCPFP